MSKEDALAMIDSHKNKLINPREMLGWTWLRVIILKMSDEAWNDAANKATKILSQ